MANTKTNQLLPFATGAGAIVLTAAQYAALAARTTGFTEGIADERQLNTVWRQSSTVAAMIGQFVSDRAGVDVLDDGDIQTLETNFITAIANVAAGQVPSLPATSYVHSGLDVSGSATSLISDVTPSITKYEVGNLYLIRASKTAQGATVANFDGIGTRNVLRSDGSPIKIGDWNGGEMLMLLDDGANLLLYGAKSSLAPARNLQQFTSAGSYGFTVPAGIFWLFVEIVGAGAGGAGGGRNTPWSSGGGGSGGFAGGWIPVTPGQVIPCVVGAKGLGAGNADGAVGGNGGTTTFGTFLTGTGGQGGKGASNDAGGGGPGQGFGGQKNFPGGSGGDGNPTNPGNPGGNGAASAFGGGGRTSTFNRALMNGQAPGSGGGGIWSNSGTASELGGNGADGAIFVQY